ncbi:putative cytochrome oxid [Paramicrosporidium saccamoebae]|uniref:Putative cytochrome oxid n=1 Tax=Paramicrosporidium saccamoebae TaxID=1246581 RepID=A0A2H9TFD2_9FUNG|nr:putative cytochrome oxid [Paramicrosporidium saccamoebae]
MMTFKQSCSNRLIPSLHYIRRIKRLPYSTAPDAFSDSKIVQSVAETSPVLNTQFSGLSETSISTSGKWEYILNGSVLWPANITERLIETIHLSTGLTWTATLVVYTIGLRALLFPLSIKQTRSTIMANNLKPRVQELQAESEALRNQGKQEESRQKIRDLAAYMSKNDINPVKILGLSLFPLPFFMATFFAIRNMASQPMASLVNGGVLWFQDLTAADPYYILPALSTATLLLTMEGLWATKIARRFFRIPDIVYSSVPNHRPASFIETFKETYKANLRQSGNGGAGATNFGTSAGRPIKVYSQKPKNS